jgi:hypothetical protein
VSSSHADKIAGAPISWGVCEVPGWGYQLSPERVLRQMREVGHLHLKDVDSTIARRFNPARSPIPRPCGRACTDHWEPATSTWPRLSATCGPTAHDGWYTLEQDTVPTGDPEGEGPVADVRTTLECLRKGPRQFVIKQAPRHSAGGALAFKRPHAGDARLAKK